MDKMPKQKYAHVESRVKQYRKKIQMEQRERAKERIAEEINRITTNESSDEDISMKNALLFEDIIKRSVNLSGLSTMNVERVNLVGDSVYDFEESSVCTADLMERSSLNVNETSFPTTPAGKVEGKRKNSILKMFKRTPKERVRSLSYDNSLEERLWIQSAQKRAAEKGHCSILKVFQRTSKKVLRSLSCSGSEDSLEERMYMQSLRKDCCILTPQRACNFEKGILRGNVSTPDGKSANQINAGKPFGSVQKKVSWSQIHKPVDKLPKVLNIKSKPTEAQKEEMINNLLDVCDWINSL